MNIKAILILTILIFSFVCSGQDLKNCETSLDKMFESGSVSAEKLQEFLKLQSELTMHRMAYALLRNETSKGRFKVEEKILSLLEAMKDKNQSAEFKNVYDKFNDSNNKLSRTALAEVLPFIKDILNDQIDEQDPVKREMFNLGMSDIKILAILTEKEKRYKNGAYAHLLSANTDSDKSVLNFIKIINSSIQNTNDSVANIKKRMSNRIDKLVQNIDSLVGEITLGSECEKEIQACMNTEVRHKPILNEKVLLGLVQAIDKLDALDKHKYLRYGDVWLHTKGSNQTISKQTISKKINRKSTYHQKDLKVIVPSKKSNDEIINDYLVSHVLDYLPNFFTREDLLRDPELTRSLAFSIDSGVLTKKGEERSFSYKGKLYAIPELWNDTYSNKTLGISLGRPGAAVKGWFSRWTMDEDDDFIIPKENKIPKNLEEEFKEARDEQREVFNHKYSFSFKGKIYDLKSGREIPKNKKSIFMYPLNKKGLVLKEYSETEKKKIVVEIENGARSFFSENGKTRHISGAEVKLDKEISRARLDFSKSNINISKTEKDISFPKDKSIKEFVKNNPSKENLVLKTLADKNRAAMKDGDLIDIVKLKIYSKDDAIKLIVDKRKSMGADRSPNQFQGFDGDYLKANAAAILNNRPYFNVKNQKYHTNNGFKISEKRKTNSLYKGYVDSDEVKENLDKMNTSNSNFDLVLKYHKNMTNNSCDYYTVVDKKQKELKVVRNNGEILFHTEILIGKTVGDERTLYNNYEERVTNNKTGAGIFEVGKRVSQNTSYHNQFEGQFLGLNAITDTGPGNTAMAMYQISDATIERNSLLNDNNLNNNRVTNGGISLKKEAMATYLKDYSKEGCPYYVLPETNKVYFEIVENSIVLKSKNCTTEDCEKNYNLSNNVSVKSKPIKVFINDDRYKNTNTEKFIQTLTKEKSEIMSLLNLTNNEYDELVKLSFGVMGVETDFGSTLLYKFKETKIGQGLIDYSKGNTLPNIVSPAVPIPLSALIDNPGNSRGPTQIKNVKSYLKGKFKNIETADLSKPENAAIATLFVLSQKLQILKQVESKHSNITPQNRMEYLYYLYMGSSDQITKGGATPKLNPKAGEVIDYASKITVLTKE